MGVASDYQDALLAAQADMLDAMRDLQKELQAGMMDQIADQVWAQLTPELREQFKQDDPDGYAQFMKRRNENGRKK